MPYQAEPVQKAPDERSFLVLQGLSSRFFTVLCRHLQGLGHTVYRVSYCGGDWLLARGSGDIQHLNFRGMPDQLDSFYDNILREKGITDIILFGDCRPVHKTAITVAQRHNVPVFVFEEGYTRPHWVTLECGGTNDYSPLPRTAQAVKDCAAQIPDSTSPRPDLPNPMVPRVFWDLAFHAGRLLGKPFFPHYRTHRPDTPADEIIGWFARLWRKLQFESRNRALIAHYRKYHETYFLVPLQLNSDFQIREHSPYPDVPCFIRDVILSFARHAPAKARLLFKMHPLDNGMIDYRHLIADLARESGVTERTDYIEGGDLDSLLSGAKGAVMINSTVGFRALMLSTPIKVTGRAIYDMEGLSAQGSLDSFWGSPTKPEPALVADFIKLVRSESQLYGDFFTQKGMKMVAKAAIGKMPQTAPDRQESPNSL